MAVNQLRDQPAFEPRIAISIAAFAWLQRSMLTEVYTRYQLVWIALSIMAIELLVMPLLGCRPSLRSLTLNTLLAASAMILAKWQIEGINWSSALRKIERWTQ